MSVEKFGDIEMKNFITPSGSTLTFDTESIVDIEDYEHMPLDCELPIELVHGRKISTKRSVSRGVSQSWRGPLKAMKIIFIAAVVPSLFISIPLYLRYMVYSNQLYPVGMSDMRLIDKKVSTTWCQRQVVRSNATFNAFLMSGSPSISSQIIPVSMTRQLRLEDDMKEYWGFYLLEGSMVTVSTCVRWPGASLIMIRGHKHLKECAYIGDDSSEELEEVLRAGGKLSNATLQKLFEQPSNRPTNMTRHLSGVKFHEPRPPALNTDSAEEFHTQPHDEEKDLLDPKMFEMILTQLKQTQNKKKKNRDPLVRPNKIVPVQKLTHRYRETNVNEEEEKWLSFKDLEGSTGQSDEFYDEMDDKNFKIIKNDDDLIETEIKEADRNDVNKTAINIPRNPNNDELLVVIPVLKDEKIDDVIIKTTNKTSNVTETNNTNPSIVQSSTEIFEDIFNKLEKLGDKGKQVLERLNHKLKDIDNTNNSTNGQEIPETTTANYEISKDYEGDSFEDVEDKKWEAIKTILLEVIKEERRAKNERQARKKKENIKRLKRQLFIEQKLQNVLAEDDEKGNAAIEEEFEPDGIADHHVRLNETTLNDMSRSEFWSSFSSSEEALLECDGLILNLPLTPNKNCVATNDSRLKHDDVSKANTVTYMVPTNGYYFFVFNSENEVQENYIRVRFDLKKTVYDVNEGKVMECKNSTDKCAIPLAFFSGEKVVFEVPVMNNDSLWNEDFVVISECEPRTLIYIFCVIAVPVFILMMAMH